MKTKRFRTRICAVLLGIAVVVSQLYMSGSTPVSAEPDYVASIIDINDVPTSYSSFDDALAAWTPGTTLKLLKDTVLNHSIVLNSNGADVFFKLDLNNCGLRLDQAASGSVIYLDGSGSAEFSIEISDTAVAKTTHYIELDANGRGTDVSQSQPSSGIEGTDYISVSGGYITGGAAPGTTPNGGGICAEYSSVIINGGNIVGNTASKGGGIYVCNGLLDIDGGNIIKNSASKDGGGIYASGTVLSMFNGNICYNTSKGFGGGIYLKNVNKISEITGGTVAHNYAEEGGGIYNLYADISLKNDANISYNHAGSKSGGLYFSNASLSISDKVSIINNTLLGKNGSTSPSNILFNPSYGDILIDNHLSGEIGISVIDGHDFIAHTFAINCIGEALSDSDIACFVSDSPDLKVVKDSSSGNIKTILNDGSKWAAFRNSFLEKENNQNDPTIITLEDNYISSPNSNSIYIPEDTYVILDLNGYKIDRGLSDFCPRDNGSVIEVCGNLTIIDSSTDKSGMLTGGNSYAGGGIAVSLGASLIMEGGTISGNSASEGGGIYVNGGYLSMKGNAKVTKNIATVEGGGVLFSDDTYYNYYGIFDVSGNATVTDNHLDDVSETPSNVLFMDFNKNPINVAGPLTGEIGISTKGLTEDGLFFEKVCIPFAKAVPSSNTPELTLSDVKAFTSDYPDYVTGISLQESSWDFYLGKPITVENIPSGYYNENAIVPSITVKNDDALLTDSDYELHFFNASEEVAPAELIYPGTYTVTVLGSGEYGGIVDKIFTINKGHNSLKTHPAALSRTADETEKALVSEGDPEHGTVMYALGIDSLTCPVNGFSPTIPTGVSAGTYYVWYMVDGGMYYENTDPACVEVTIKTADPDNPPVNNGGGGSGNGNGGGGSGNGGSGNVNGSSGNGSSGSGSSGSGSGGSGNGSGGGSDNGKVIQPIITTETLTDGSKVTKVITQTASGKVTTITTKRTDGSKNIVKKAENKDGSRTVTETEVNPDGSYVSTTVNTDRDGTVTCEYTKTDKNGRVVALSFTASGNKLKLKEAETHNKTSVTIPNTIKVDGKTYKVTQIASGAFKGNKEIKRVTIGKNVTSIGKNAFNGCSKLKTITIKGKVTSVGKNAFSGISKKATIKIDETKKNYKSIKKLIQTSGIPKAVKFKRI